ncbi:MAG: protein kinase [Myxococcales bacterium]|nr:protein kinase [Myxococcales bacterium]
MVKISDAALEGVILQNSYQVEKRVGRGGMAWIYRASHLRLGGEVALKILFSVLAEDEDTRQRFLREARIQYKLQHPNIIRVLDFIEVEGIVGFVMEWCAGGSLNDFLKLNPSSTLSMRDLSRLFEPILDALHYAHKQGVIHRDIKPHNILLQIQEDGFSPKLTDFGIAKMEDDGLMTETGHMLGTAAYMAPEQVRSTRDVDIRADLYSLGIMLYRLTTGRLPFTAKFPAICVDILNKEPPPPVEAHPALQEVIMRCLHKDPDQRFEDCKAFGKVLLPILEELEKEGASPSAFKDLAQTSYPVPSGSFRGSTSLDADKTVSKDSFSSQIQTSATPLPSASQGGISFSVASPSDGVGAVSSPLQEKARPRSANGLLVAGIIVLLVLVAGMGWMLGQRNTTPHNEADSAPKKRVALARQMVPQRPPNERPSREVPPSVVRPAPVERRAVEPPKETSTTRSNPPRVPSEKVDVVPVKRRIPRKKRPRRIAKKSPSLRRKAMVRAVKKSRSAFSLPPLVGSPHEPPRLVPLKMTISMEEWDQALGQAGSPKLSFLRNKERKELGRIRIKENTKACEKEHLGAACFRVASELVYGIQRGDKKKLQQQYDFYRKGCEFRDALSCTYGALMKMGRGIFGQYYSAYQDIIDKPLGCQMLGRACMLGFGKACRAYPRFECKPDITPPANMSYAPSSYIPPTMVTKKLTPLHLFSIGYFHYLKNRPKLRKRFHALACKQGYGLGCAEWVCRAKGSFWCGQGLKKMEPAERERVFHKRLKILHRGCQQNSVRACSAYANLLLFEFDGEPNPWYDPVRLCEAVDRAAALGDSWAFYYRKRPVCRGRK